MRNLFRAKATRLAGRGRREHTLERRREEHIARVAWWQGLTLTERIKVLDDRFGPGQGACKQRARMALQVAA